jgi:hypothetical protein
MRGAFHFGYPDVGIEIGYGERFDARFFDCVFYLQEVE